MGLGNELRHLLASFLGARAFIPSKVNSRNEIEVLLPRLNLGIAIGRSFNRLGVQLVSLIPINLTIDVVSSQIAFRIRSPKQIDKWLLSSPENTACKPEGMAGGN